MKTNEGYENCEECKGRGYIFQKEHTIYRCTSCRGFGELDWVEKVTQSFRSRGGPCMTLLLDRWKKDTKMEFYLVKATSEWIFGEPYEDNYNRL